MTADQIIKRALQEPTLTGALTVVAMIEQDRAVAQAREFDRTGVSTAAFGTWDCCFGLLCDRVMEAWVAQKFDQCFETST